MRHKMNANLHAHGEQHKKDHHDPEIHEQDTKQPEICPYIFALGTNNIQHRNAHHNALNGHKGPEDPMKHDRNPSHHSLLLHILLSYYERYGFVFR